MELLQARGEVDLLAQVPGVLDEEHAEVEVANQELPVELELGVFDQRLIHRAAFEQLSSCRAQQVSQHLFRNYFDFG